MKPTDEKPLRRLAITAYECLDTSFAAGLIYSSLVKWRFRHCGTGLRLATTTFIRGHRNISIGDDFSSMGHLYLYANDGGALEIGDECSVNSNVQLGAAAGRIKIGNGVMIGPNVVIRAANHGMRRDLPMRRQPWTPSEITIEDDVWIAANAVITGGVAIALGTVIAAGAVVTQSTERYSIVGGIPARKIGERL